ncbi:hypothetical protein V512_011695 [Mesotoga sp. Brook.08.105.5.1]|nr:hypothetical protein V512_011695 [Mesotoga sp. Brook.08.105.5.1]
MIGLEALLGEPITDNHFLIQLESWNLELMIKNLDTECQR